MRPVRNRKVHEREIIYRGVLTGKSLEEINSQLPPEVALPPSSYDMVERYEARAIEEGKVTIEELARRPLSRGELSRLLESEEQQ